MINLVKKAVHIILILTLIPAKLQEFGFFVH